MYRSNQAIFEKSFLSPFITAILGPRRVGKTTLVAHFIEKHANFVWAKFNLDSLAEREQMTAKGLRLLIEQQVKQRIGEKEKIWVSIDEAQKDPALFEQIKILYDEFKDKEVIKFILTGSALLNLHQLSSESLAGRIELLHLRPFGLSESFAFHAHTQPPQESFFDLLTKHSKPEIIQAFIQEREILQPELQKMLLSQCLWGGLPEVLAIQNEEKKIQYLSNYLQIYLERDIRDVKTITDLPLYRKLLQIIAEQTGSLREDRRISEILGCKTDTLKKYRGFLEATMFYSEIYPFISSILKRLVKSPKGYLLDNGLISYLTGLSDITILEKTGMIGKRFENWFLNELHIWLDRTIRRNDIQFWRTPAGAEVDFIVTILPETFPFEVTYSSKILPQKVRHLKNFMETENVSNGFYIYNGDFHYDQKNRIFFIPAYAVG